MLQHETLAGMSEPESEQATQVPPIDRQGLISRCLGSSSFALSLLDEFASASRQLVDEISARVSADDCDGVAESAHAIKGAAAIIGATTVRQAALEIELSARAGDRQQLAEQLHCLQRHLDRCHAELPRLRQSIEQQG